MRYDGVGMPVQGCFQNHFVVGVAQHRSEPERYVNWLAQGGKGVHDPCNVVELVTCDYTGSRTAQNRLIFQEESRGAQERRASHLKQSEERITRPPTTPKSSDNYVGV